MPTVNEVYEMLNRRAPFSTQMSFDNAGFLVGEGEQPVSRVLVALDITQAVAEEAAAAGCQLIVSHHPVIFHPSKHLTDRDAQGKLLRTLVKADISAICAHTNLDVAVDGVNDCLAEALGLTEIGLLNHEGEFADGTPYGCGRVGTWNGPEELLSFLPAVAKGLSCSGLRYTDAGRPVRRVAVGGGACYEYITDAAAKGCDTFVTSDVKYNGFLDAVDLGINLVDAGHFPTENVVCARLVQWLREEFPGLEVSVSEVQREPYRYYVPPETV